MRKACAPSCCLAAVLLFVSCDNAASPDPASPLLATITISAPADSVFFGDSVQLVATANPAPATSGTSAFVWTSADTTVALVDSVGLVRGVSTGAAAITVRLGDIAGAYTVRVVLHRVDGGVSFASMARGSRFPHCALAVDGSPYCQGVDAQDPTLFSPLPRNEGLVFNTFHVSFHSRCGLTTLNLMYCWGRNGYVHFGNAMPETFTTDTAPVLGAHGRTFKALTVGGHSQTCGVNAEDDVVYCFGHNDFGQVGRGTRSARDTAVAPTGGAPRGKAVTTSEFHSCLITPEGQPMCWGDEQLTPTLVATPEPLTSVAMGGGHRCGFGESGALYCWGLNVDGEAGIGTDQSGVAMATRVAGDVEFSDVFPGAFATCAVTAGGALYCWGDFRPRSVSSRLGEARRAPVRLLPGLSFKSVAINALRTCAVTTDGRLYCWE